MEAEATVRPPSATHEDMEKSALSPSHSANGCFDCYICLDFTVEPVVTLCGHLYCWPCIHKWLKQAEADSPQHCPVCKASLSREALVPLYGRGRIITRQPQDIPLRPSFRSPESPISVSRIRQPPILQHGRHHYGYPYGDHVSSPRMIQSMAGGMIEEAAIAVLPWVFGNQVGVYYSSTAGRNGGGPRARTQEIRVQKLLHQIWVFLLCCVVLCLLLF